VSGVAATEGKPLGGSNLTSAAPSGVRHARRHRRSAAAPVVSALTLSFGGRERVGKGFAHGTTLTCLVLRRALTHHSAMFRAHSDQTIICGHHAAAYGGPTKGGTPRAVLMGWRWQLDKRGARPFHEGELRC
jgi:hypothetical protein